MELTGKHVWITGAAGALGQAMVQHCVRRGARVSATDLNRAACDAMAVSGSIQSAACDITDTAAVMQAYGAITQAFGPVDILINNAGITHFSPMRDTAIAVYEKIMRVNLLGALYCTKACLSDIEARSGAIIAVSSAAGFGPLAERTGYSASKHAMNGMFTSLAAELPSAKVYVVCPSFIRDDSGQKAAPQSSAASDGTARPGADASKNHGKGMTADEAAQEILALLGKSSGVYPIGRVGRLAHRIQRYAPGLYVKLMLRGMRKG